MIRITVTKDELSVRGHAHEGEGPVTKTETEACAAVTALVHQLYLSMRVLGHEGDTARVSFLQGNFILRERQKISTVSEVFLTGFLIGAKAVSTAYPEQIEFIDCCD